MVLAQKLGCEDSPSPWYGELTAVRGWRGDQKGKLYRSFRISAFSLSFLMS